MVFTLTPVAPPLPSRTAWLWTSVTAVAVLALGFIVFADAARIDRLTIVNETEYAMSVSVKPAEHALELGLTTVRPQRTSVVEEVLDQGGRWIFGVRAQARDVGTIELTRSALVQADWRLTLGVELAAGLRAAGVPPSPGEEQAPLAAGQNGLRGSLCVALPPDEVTTSRCRPGRVDPAR